MFGAGRIIVSQAIAQADLGRAPHDGFHVHDGHSAHRFQRNNLKRRDGVVDVGRYGRLHSSDDDILPTIAAAASFVQHAKTFADTGRVAEEDLQAAGRLMLFFGLQLFQQLFGRRPFIVDGCRHSSIMSLVFGEEMVELQV